MASFFTTLLYEMAMLGQCIQRLVPPIATTIMETAREYIFAEDGNDNTDLNKI